MASWLSLAPTPKFDVEVVRRAAGLPDHPTLAIVTGRGDLPAEVLDALDELHGHFSALRGLKLGSAPGQAELMAQVALLFIADHETTVNLIGNGPEVLTRIDADFAGRAYAAYGGIYIASALLWLWIAEGGRPDRWDLLGVAICLAGAAIILTGPRPVD